MKLSRADIESRIRDLSGWSFGENQAEKDIGIRLILPSDCIIKSVSFSGYPEQIEFTFKMGELSEIHNHHPYLISLYRKLSILLYTHDAGGVSELDFFLAQKIDSLVGK